MGWFNSKQDDSKSSKVIPSDPVVIEDDRPLTEDEAFDLVGKMMADGLRAKFNEKRDLYGFDRGVKLTQSSFGQWTASDDPTLPKGQARIYRETIQTDRIG